MIVFINKVTSVSISRINKKKNHAMSNKNHDTKKI